MRYNLPLDENMDADIIEWLDSIPKKRRAEQVRAAIRMYKAAQQKGIPIDITPHTPRQSSAVDTKTERKKPKDILAD
ncbi:hypothetical protein [Paenibacillus sp. Soil522]|uniref:hypothetical protein n=1 Tax=Paenibacillus sp. Soil522 TaxID=1736388 RepID=UPI0007023A07|nr:hypothetical protein [Paenibacillus sp. Soil522]KRE35619.1 hypothetical protein ASG81_20455 [Paenibacillus sp. Soil522]